MNSRKVQTVLKISVTLIVGLSTHERSQGTLGGKKKKKFGRRNAGSPMHYPDLHTHCPGYNKHMPGTELFSIKAVTK